MLDIKRIRESLEDIKKAMNRRGEKEFNLDEVVELDDKRKELLKEVEVLCAWRRRTQAVRPRAPPPDIQSY